MPPETPPSKAWVLTHRHYDGSGFLVLRAYRSSERADEDKALLDALGANVSGEVQIHELELR